MRAALYARFSTENQREASIEDQYRACTRVAIAAGITVVDQFADRGISGGTADRPGYQGLLASARAGQFDIVIAEDISRLWRNRSEYGQRSAEFEDRGIHLLTCVGDDTRRDGWGLVLGIKQAIAEHQRREISYRTLRGLEGRALAGESTGGRCYGYNGIAVLEPQARVVRYIFQLYAAGCSFAGVALQLNGEAIPAPRGGPWRPSTVDTLLANPRYRGEAIWGRSTARGSARDSARRHRVTRPEGPLTLRQDEAQRIVPENLWQAARDRRAA